MTIERQVFVDRANGGRPFADRGRDPFSRSGADVADREQPGMAESVFSRANAAVTFVRAAYFVENWGGYYAADVFDPDGYSFEVVHKS